MRQTTKTEEVKYFSPTLQDAIAMVPLMDRLARELMRTNNEVHKHEAGTVRYTDALKDYLQVARQLWILTSMGFSASIEEAIQFDPDLFPECRNRHLNDC